MQILLIPWTLVAAIVPTRLNELIHDTVVAQPVLAENEAVARFHFPLRQDPEDIIMSIKQSNLNTQRYKEIEAWKFAQRLTIKDWRSFDNVKYWQHLSNENKLSIATASAKKDWLASPEFLQDFYVSNTNWGLLTEEQRFFSTKRTIPLDAVIKSMTGKRATLKQFNVLLHNNLDELLAKVRPVFISTQHYEVSPGMVWWLRHIPPAQLLPREETILNLFGGKFFDDSTIQKDWQFGEYTEAQKVWVIDQFVRYENPIVFPDEAKFSWIQSRPYAETSEILRDWQLRNIPWSSLSEELKFQSFKFLIRFHHPEPTLKEFNAMVQNDFPNTRKIVEDQLAHILPLIIDLPEKLFWIQKIPKFQRTMADKGYMNAYGYGAFDQYGTVMNRRYPSARRFSERSLILKALMADRDLPEEATWLWKFEKEMKATFGPAEYINIQASMTNLQGWITAYFHFNFGHLTAMQKSWGLKEMSQLRSPEGIHAFQELTVQIALRQQEAIGK